MVFLPCFSAPGFFWRFFKNKTALNLASAIFLNPRLFLEGPLSFWPLFASYLESFFAYSVYNRAWEAKSAIFCNFLPPWLPTKVFFETLNFDLKKSIRSQILGGFFESSIGSSSEFFGYLIFCASIVGPTDLHCDCKFLLGFLSTLLGTCHFFLGQPQHCLELRANGIFD